MDTADLDEWPGRWRFAVAIILICWVVSFLSILSWLILPLLGFAVARASKRGAWRPLAMLFLMNPFTVYFAGGMIEYVGGAPRMRYIGLPGLEFWNPDPITRCDNQTGGCVVSGNKWVSRPFHNLGVATLAKIFGPPARAYDGPYPKKDVALKVVSSSPKLNVQEFVKGRIDIGGKQIRIDPEMMEKTIGWLGYLSLTIDEIDEKKNGSFVQAAMFEDRCLILRLVGPNPMSSSTYSSEQDCIILMDLKNLRPFAYYLIKGYHDGGRPPVRYFPGESD